MGPLRTIRTSAERLRALKQPSRYPCKIYFTLINYLLASVAAA